MIFFVIDCFKFADEAFSLYVSQTVHFQSVDFEFLSSDPLVYLLGEEAEASPSIANTLWRV